MSTVTNFPLERRGRELGLEPRELVEDVVKIDEIPDEGLLLHVERPAGWLATDVPLSGGLEGWLLLFKIGREVTVEVDFGGTLELECGRCLKDYALRVRPQFRSMYLPARESERDEEVELAEDDLGVTFYHKPLVDVRELLREELILSVPLQPVCAEDCPGLCPSCGADLATAACTCRAEAADPRFSALGGLLDALNKNPREPSD